MEDSLGRTNEAVGRSNISTCVESVNIFEDGASWPKGLESAYEEVARKYVLIKTIDVVVVVVKGAT